MSDISKTIEVVLRGRNDLGSAFTAGGRVVGGFVSNTIGSVKRAVDSIFSLQNAVEGAAVVLAAKAVFEPAIEMERFQTQFKVLLGGLDQAKVRMTELTKFADTTPFELPEVAMASKALQVMTDGALATGSGLRMIGDVAAGTGAPFSELAVTAGRLYAGIKGGGEIGEAMQRMSQLGAISGEARNKIYALKAEGASSAEIWRVVTAEFARFNGQMEELSKTAGGRISTLSDSWRAVRREVGEAALPALKKAIEDIIAEIEKLKASGELEKWGKQLGSALTGLMDVLVRLSKFVSDHGKEIKYMLAAYAGYRVINELTRSLTTLQAVLAATKLQQAAADMNKLSGAADAGVPAVTGLGKAVNGVGTALGIVAKLGGSFAVGWGIGTLIRDFTGLGAALDKFVERRYFTDPNFHPLNINKESKPEIENIRVNAYFKWIQEGKSPIDFQADWDKRRKEFEDAQAKAIDKELETFFGDLDQKGDGLSDEKSAAYIKKMEEAQAKLQEAREKL